MDRPEYVEFVARSGDTIIAKISSITKLTISPNGSCVSIEGADGVSVSDETASELRNLLNQLAVVTPAAPQPSTLQAS